MNPNAQALIQDIDTQLAQLTGLRASVINFYGTIKNKSAEDAGAPAQPPASITVRSKADRPGSVAAEPGKAGRKAKRAAPQGGKRGASFERAAAAREAILQLRGTFTSKELLKHVADAGIKGLDKGTRIYGILASLVKEGSITKEGRNFIIGDSAGVDKESARRTAEYEATKAGLGVAVKPKEQ